MTTGDIIKSIRFDKETAEKIQKMADEAERNFGAQVRFIVNEYIRSREMKCPAGDNPPAGLVYIMQFPLNAPLSEI